jgi:VWFA-related protein
VNLQQALAANLLLMPLVFAAGEVPIRVEARVVNVDVVVRHKETRRPVRGLKAEDFRLRVDGKDRSIAYFRADSGERSPLLLLIFFNLAPEGALRELSQAPALESFARALSRLSPDDEVAVFAAQNWFVGRPRILSTLSKDRQAGAAALRQAVESALQMTKEQNRRDGRSRERSMSAAVDSAIAVAAVRPDAQIALVYVSDGMNTLDTMEAKSRDELALRLEEHNISFNALNLNMLTSYAAAAAVLNPIGKAFGIGVTGAADDYSKQTGGVAIDVARPQELGNALEQITSAFVSRYSLGFQLAGDEYRDGRRHKLEVRLSGRDLLVSARRGFRDKSSR